MSDELVRVRDLKKIFSVPAGELHAVDGVDFSIARGSTIGIVGESGCGKSTLLRMLCGLDFPTEGEILWNGEQITGPGMDRGMVFQGYTLFPWMRVLDNVAYGLRASGMSKQERMDVAKQFLSDIGPEDFAQVYPSQLSGGMRQRVAIARALAANPESLLLDEPFGALDAQTRRHMQELTLQMWRKYPKTVIMVTHDVEEAILMADRVVIMSAHPGCVREVLEIDIPRPRDAAVKRTEQFRKYKKYCIDIILEESQKAEMRIED